MIGVEPCDAVLERAGLPGAKHAEDVKLFVSLALNPVSIPFVQSTGLYDLLWQPAMEPARSF